jgi:exopolysaccharide biosynthesis protein
MLVKNGSVFVTAKAEEFPADIAVGRAPRTALGVTKDGHVLLVVVDGRQPDHSIGMTLTELAGFMKELGATQAMNLDGGGSSEMTVGEKVVNIPSDGRERDVGTAIAVQQK